MRQYFWLKFVFGLSLACLWFLQALQNELRLEDRSSNTHPDQVLENIMMAKRKDRFVLYGLVL
jgi:hypothetical protein